MYFSCPATQTGLHVGPSWFFMGRANDCKQLKLCTNIKITVVLYSPKELNLALCHVVIQCNVINVVSALLSTCDSCNSFSF